MRGLQCHRVFNSILVGLTHPVNPQFPIDIPFPAPIGIFNRGPVKSVPSAIKVPRSIAIGSNPGRTIGTMQPALNIPLLAPIGKFHSRPVDSVQLVIEVPLLLAIGQGDGRTIDTVSPALDIPLLASIGTFNRGSVKSVQLTVRVPRCIGFGVCGQCYSRTIEAVQLALNIPLLQATGINNSRPVEAVQHVSVIGLNFDCVGPLMGCHAPPIHGIGNNAGTFEGIDKVPSHGCQIYHLVYVGIDLYPSQ